LYATWILVFIAFVVVQNVAHAALLSALTLWVSYAVETRRSKCCRTTDICIHLKVLYKA